MTRIATQYIMQAGLLAAYGGSPILGVLWFFPPAAANSTSHPSQMLDADFAAAAEKSASNTQSTRTAVECRFIEHVQ
ncbi:MAG: hypothetical protein ACJ797_03955 [Ktedonobacteraceae bacterium]